MKMAWTRSWTLICTLILLAFLQESVCFRIKYEPDVKDEESNSPETTKNDTQGVQKISHIEKLGNKDVNISEEPKSNLNNQPEKREQKNSHESTDISQPQTGQLKGVVRNPAMRRIVENEDSEDYDNSEDPGTQSPDDNFESENSKVESEKIPEVKIISENNFSVKQSPAEVFKGFGRNPAFRKLAEIEDALVSEKLASNVKSALSDQIETNTESPRSEAENSLKSDSDIESGKPKSDSQIEEKITHPKSIKPVINMGTDKPPVSTSTTGALKSSELKEGTGKIDTGNEQKSSVDDISTFLNAADLTGITQSSGKGEAQSIECDLPHLDVYSRCFANIMEVTVTSRSALLGRISFQEAEGHIDISGNTLVFYAVYGRQTVSGFMWELKKGVTAEDVWIACNDCHTLDLRMIVLVMEEFQEKNKRCVVDLTCTQQNMPDQPSLGIAKVSQNKTPQDSVISGPSTSRVHSAKTTLNILKGISMESEVLPQDHLPVDLGTKLGISISAYTREISLDLHILMCEARGEDGLTSALIKDGCSVHHMVEEFREVLGMVHDPEIDDHHIVRVTQHTTFEVFNFSPKPQTIAIICKIKMCGGECDERPGCVNSEVNLGHRKQKSFTVFYEEVVLGQMLNVGGVPELAGGPQNSDFMSNIIEPEEERIGAIKEGEENTLDIHANCIPRSVFYLSLFVLGGLFILLLVLALYFSKAIVLPRMTSYKYQNDEVESPSRALYQEYSSPRRRSPGSKSPDQQHSVLDRIVYS